MRKDAQRKMAASADQPERKQMTADSRVVWMSPRTFRKAKRFWTLSKKDQVGPAAIFPVFLGQSQEFEAVQGGSQEDIRSGEGTAAEPQLVFLPWSGRETRWRWGGLSFCPPITPPSSHRLHLWLLSAGHSVSKVARSSYFFHDFGHMHILPILLFSFRSADLINANIYI